MTARQIRDDLIAESNAGRDRFVRTMILEMYRLSGQMHALAELMTNYIGGDAGPETDEHRAAAVKPTPRPARPPARSSAMATDVSVVGAAPAGTAERPPQPIPVSDSALPPRAVPASPLAVESPPAAPSEDKPIPQPAPFPSVQNEAEGIQGEDQRAQKEVSAPNATSAGAASAGHRNADPRNSSRPVGEGPVLIPAGRTTSAIKSKPLDPRPGRVAGVTITAPGKVIAVDMENFVIACPGGDWQTSRPVAQIMERMKDGDTFGHDVLADIGSMSPSIFADSKHRWTEELAKRGVEFVHIKGVGCKIRLAETA